jgi:hypothetical protein
MNSTEGLVCCDERDLVVVKVNSMLGSANTSTQCLTDLLEKSFFNIWGGKDELNFIPSLGI